MPESQSLPVSRTCCPVLELRQYTLHPGKRDELIVLFERAFIESQEALGISIVGQFRDLDNPDRFVWLRGFSDMPTRAGALNAFYSGPIWQAHRNAANATMMDSDNVLLLRPADGGSGFASPHTARPAFGAQAVSTGMVVASIYYFDTDIDPGFIELFNTRVVPAVTEAGAQVLATWVTETAANTFPRLPVRERERVFVWFTRFDDVNAYARYHVKLHSNPAWKPIQTLLESFVAREETLRLAPTPRSLLPAS